MNKMLSEALQDFTGLLNQLMKNLLGSDAEMWGKEFKKFLRKEPCWGTPTEKFALLADLGMIIVPDDYDPKNRLTLFGKENRKKFYYYNDDITDANFPNPTRVLKPGDKLRVRVFEQTVKGNTTSEERMAFLATQKAVHTGAQGASLVFEQKRDQLPKGKWYCSFDEKDRLWKDADGRRRVPFVGAYSGGDFRFCLGCFRDGWDGAHCLLCFCDE